MNGKHASGRLTTELAAAGGATMLVTEFPLIVARVSDADDARRLAAAWNACEGSATDRVEELAEIGGIPALVVYSDDVRRERDEARAEAARLLQAMQRIHDLSDGEMRDGDEARRIAGEFIKKGG